MKKKALGKIKGAVSLVSLLIFLSLMSHLSFGQTIETLSFIHSPQDLSKWLLSEFRYEMELPDYWQKAGETLKLKKGDCEDFAILTQSLLKDLNIPSDIVIVKFKALNLTHMINIFKNNEFYSYFSNQHLVQTKGRSVIEAVKEQYPDWDKIIFTNAKKQILKVIPRTNL